MKSHNFSAGPAILPAEVLQEAAEGVKDLNGSGLSILEISHRSKAFEAVIHEAEALLRETYQISDEYAVLFLSGGASTQFFMAPLNLLAPGTKAGYVDTGTWANKAMHEAKEMGEVVCLASSQAEHYRHIPKHYTIPDDLSYVHITTNNTIFGTQMHSWPDCKPLFVADMSSDFVSRPIDLDRYGLIYAGAQKNLGPAGVTIVILRKDWIHRSGRKLTHMLDYKTHQDNHSLYNTPPVYAIYVSMLTLRWIKKLGGLTAMEERNQIKAAALYAEIDRNPLFKGTTVREDRSLMNVTFVPLNDEHTDPFLKLCQQHRIIDLKGHRSVGGFRASIYNAMPLESVQVLVQVMQEFEKSHG